MAKFSEFIKNNKNASAKNQSTSYTNDDLEKMINNYSQLSEDKLMSEFIKLTLEKKKRGELTEKELENLKSTLYPLLDDNQRKSLSQILEMVKNVK